MKWNVYQATSTTCCVDHRYIALMEHAREMASLARKALTMAQALNRDVSCATLWCAPFLVLQHAPDDWVTNGQKCDVEEDRNEKIEGAKLVAATGGWRICFTLRHQGDEYETPMIKWD
jgi:hypothetical protein